jgi:hypothetical protein
VEAEEHRSRQTEDTRSLDINLIWRFYSGPDHRWRWQRLSFDKAVVQQSETGYKEYEACLANAREHGYVFQPSQSTRPESTSPKGRRSYWPSS